MRYVDPHIVVEKHLNGRQMPKWTIAIMCFHSKEKTLVIAKQFGATLLGYRVFSKCDESVVFQAKLNGVTVGILGWCTGGGPLVASLVEELAVLGVKYIIGIGAAASITPKIDIQSIVLATGYQLNDGVSCCYDPISKESHIDPYMYLIFSKVMQRMTCKVLDVKAGTIEAIYLQDERVLAPLRKENCEIVNWEISPFYTVSNHCKIKALWFGHISDLEFKGKWIDWYCNRENTFQECISICMKVVELLIEGEKNES